MTAATFAELPLAQIVPSLTNPRKTFDHVKLQELTASIRESGVNTPIIVRPLPASRVADTAHLSPRPTFELVSGARRLMASEAAGIKTIPAIVRALTDTEALEDQLTENLQRDDLLPLEEAEGYDALMNAHTQPLSVQDIADRMGKSRAYVYGRLALLRLGPDGREALRLQQITAAHALLIARIPSTLVQAQALGNIFNAMTGELMSVRAAADLIQRQYMLRLAEARFAPDDAALLPKAGACPACPKRTGADPDLFADVKGADICTDPPCFKAKTEAHTAQQTQAARDAGATVIEGREAQALITPTADGRLDGYLRLDDPRDAPAGSKSLRGVIGPLMEAEGIKDTLIELPDSFAACIETDTAQRLLLAKAKQDQTEALQAKAGSSSKEAQKAAAELQKQQDRERFEHAWRWRVMEATWGKVSLMAGYSLSGDTLRQLAREHLPTTATRAEPLATFLGLGKVGAAQALREWVDEHDEPAAALALLIMYESTHNWQGSPTGGAYIKALTVCTDPLVGVVPEAIQAEVQREHTAEILARNPSLPLPSAAPADGARGGDKPRGKGRKDKPEPAALRTSEEEARSGIAAAMQSEEAGADDGPGQDQQDAQEQPEGA